MTEGEVLEQNIGLVHHVIRQSKLYAPYPYEYADIVQVGLIGLLKAVRSYDSNRAKFSTFAVPCIYYSVKAFIRDHTRQLETVPYYKELPGDGGVYLELFESYLDTEEIVIMRETIEAVRRHNPELFSKYYEQDMSQKDIAEEYGVTQKTISIWLKEMREEGMRLFYGDDKDDKKEEPVFCSECGAEITDIEHFLGNDEENPLCQRCYVAKTGMFQF